MISRHNRAPPPRPPHHRQSSFVSLHPQQQTRRNNSAGESSHAADSSIPPGSSMMATDTASYERTHAHSTRVPCITAWMCEFLVFRCFVEHADGAQPLQVQWHFHHRARVETLLGAQKGRNPACH